MPEVTHLRTARAVRERCRAVLELARAGRAPHFTVDDGRTAEIERRVLAALAAAPRARGRFGHFGAGGVDRVGALGARLPDGDGARAAAWLELVFVSVLLDAGAGAAWRFVDGGCAYARSEGLAIASLRAFERGAFSAAGEAAADAAGLEAFSDDAFCTYFAVGPDNPIAGGVGRAGLVRALGRRVRARPDLFEAGRLGGLLGPLERAARARVLDPADALAIVLDATDGVLSDVWPYAPLGAPVPLHKLAQWLVHSLAEPLAEIGVTVDAASGALTGLADYRNGGLLVDAGALVPRAPEELARAWPVSSELVVEWRALTVALLDELAARLRARGPVDARALEAATWAAGRAVALERRADGGPPVTVESDGTVF